MYRLEVYLFTDSKYMSMYIRMVYLSIDSRYTYIQTLSMLIFRLYIYLCTDSRYTYVQTPDILMYRQAIKRIVPLRSACIKDQTQLNRYF